MPLPIPPPAEGCYESQNVIIGASVSDADAKRLFPGGWTTIKPQPKS
jgi:hypothetical protein